MEDERQRRFLAARYEYQIDIYGDKLAQKEIVAKMNERGIQHQHIVFETVAAESTIQFAFNAAGLAIQALTFLYTILKDRKKQDDINITFKFPNSAVINVYWPEDLESILDRLKEIDPKKDEEDRKQIINYYKKKYQESYKD
jgi:hypothetical protein